MTFSEIFELSLVLSNFSTLNCSFLVLVVSRRIVNEPWTLVSFERNP